METKFKETEIGHTRFKETKIGRIPEEWEVISIRGINKARFDSVNPANSPQEIFEYYSIPAYLECGMPAIERGESILSNKLLVTSNTVLFGKLNPRVLKVWLVKPSTTYRQVASTEFLPILPNEKAVPGFIYYLCQSAFIAENSKQYAVGTTPSRQRVNPKAFYDMPLPLPPLPEQRKIAEILSTVDETIEKTDAIIEETKQLKRGLMQKLFTEGIGHTRFKETKIGRIPEEWEVVRLGDFCERITKGTTPTSVGFGYQDKGINFIKIESIDDNGNFLPNVFAHINVETHNALERSVIKENDLLFSIAGALGRVALVNKKILPANTNQAVGIIRLKQNCTIDIKYLYFYLKGPQIQKHIQQINVQSAQANLSLAHLNKFQVLLPPLDEQRKIADILSEADAKIETEQAFKSELEQLKKGLMQVLLTGKVRVKV